MKKSRNHYAAAVISVLLAAVFTLALTALLTMYTVNKKLTDRKVFVSTIEKSDYAPLLKDHIYDMTQIMVRPTGLLIDEVVGDALTEDMVRRDAVIYAENFLQGKTEPLDTSAYREQIFENMHSYMLENDYSDTEENLESIGEMADAVVKEYTDLIAFPYLAYIRAAMDKFDSLYGKLMPILAVLAGIALLLLWSAYRFRAGGFRYLTYSLIAGILIILVPVCVLLVKKPYAKLTFDQAYLVNFITVYAENWINQLLIVCAGLAAAAVVSILITVLLEKKQSDRASDKDIADSPV